MPNRSESDSRQMPNNQTKPNQTQTTPKGAHEGISRGRITVKDQGRPAGGKIRREQLELDREWCRQHLPDEHEIFAATAVSMNRLARQEITVESVLGRLRATGRDRATLEQKGRRS